MGFLWLAVAVSLVIAVAAWVHARRTARRLGQLTEMYWELKYQYSELRAETRARAGDAGTGAGDAPAARPDRSFVPLTSLKR